MRPLSKLLFTLLLVIIHPVLTSFGYMTREDKFSSFLEGEEISALVAIKGGMYLRQGHAVGFHFELLNRFAEHQRCNVKIKPAFECDPFEQLINKEVDIIVVDSGKDTIPDEYIPLVISSIDLNEFDQVWVVRRENYQLLENLNYWFNFYRQSKDYLRLVNTYYKRYRGVSYASGPVTVLSPYDHLIKRYSSNIGWDWRLLAALIYQESKFTMNAHSGRGAQGLMQVKSSTAGQFEIEDLFDPEQNIKAGTLYLKRLEGLFNQPDIDSLNRIKFMLAAYNAGEGRVDDIRRLAAFKGVNHNEWNKAKEVIPYMRSRESIPDSVVKLGLFRGHETLKYVDEVLARYEIYKALVR